jgi:hypothetical protein
MQLSVEWCMCLGDEMLCYVDRVVCTYCMLMHWVGGGGGGWGDGSLNNTT